MAKYGDKRRRIMQQIADIIEYEGDNTTFIWKHPLENFNSMTAYSA